MMSNSDFLDPYRIKQILDGRYGNNAFAWDDRGRDLGKNPTLTIPALIDGEISDVCLGDDIVFEENDGTILKSCKGLRNFVNIPKKYRENGSSIPEIVVFDNHNHALYFWIGAIHRGIIEPGFELIHIDEHSDLWENNHTIDIDQAIHDSKYCWDFVNHSCNVGNYILPLVHTDTIQSIKRIENEFQMDENIDVVPLKNSVLNIDLDIFAPELDHIPEIKKIKIIKHFIPLVKYITIATSPFFIDQERAIEKLNKIFTYGNQ